MKVAITGGAGGVAQVIRQLLSHRHQFTLFDLPGVGHDPTVVRGDLTRPEDAARLLEGQDALIHLAVAYINTKPDITPKEHVDVNIAGLYNLLDQAQRQGVKKVLVASSVFAHGVAKADHLPWVVYLPIDEQHPVGPESWGHDIWAMYGYTKWLSEKVCEGFSYVFGIPTFCFRFGPVLMPKPPMKYYCLELCYGYVDYRDLVAGLDLALAKEGLLHEVFNLTADDMFYCDDFFDYLVTYFHHVREIRNQGQFLRPGGHSLYDNSKARRLLGWDPRHSWKDREFEEGALEEWRARVRAMMDNLKQSGGQHATT